jgi:hypothetical protein
MSHQKNLRKAKLIYILGAGILFAFSSFTIISSSPTVLQCQFERWLSGVEQQLWKGEDPWEGEQNLTVLLAMKSHKFECCGPIDSDTNRERLIRVLSLIREAKLIKDGVHSNLLPVLEIELGGKPIFRSHFQGDSIEAQILINLLRIYQDMETTSQ